MDERKKKPSYLMPAHISSRNAPPNPENPSVQAIASVLKEYSQHRRLTHDLGFHKERITILSTAFGGTHLVTGSIDGTVRLWDMASGKCMRMFYCHDTVLSGIFVAPGRNRMITTAGFGLKKLWDLENGNCVADLSREPGMPLCCNDTHFFCKQDWDVQDLLGKGPDSKRSEILAYEVDTGKGTHTFEIPDGHIHSLVVSPDGKKIAAVSDDRCLWIWDVKSGACLHKFANGDHYQSIVGITPDSRFIVLQSAGSIDVRDMADLRVVFTVGVPSANYWSQVILKGFRLIDKKTEFNILNDHKSVIRVIDIPTATLLHTRTFKGDIDLRSITEKEGFCLSESAYGRIDVWDMENHEITASLALDPGEGWDKLTATFSGKSQVALSRHESMVRVIDLPSGQYTKAISANEPLRDVLITPDGKSLLTMGRSAVIHWDLAGGTRLREFSIPKAEPWDDLPESASLMAVTPDGECLILPSEDGVVLWDLSTGEPTGGFVFEGLPHAPENGSPGPLALNVSADGKRLMVVSGSTGFLGSYDLRTGAVVAGFPINSMGRLSVFRMDGSLFATAQNDVLSLWDGETGALLHRFNEADFIRDIVILPSRGQVASMSLSMLYVRDRETGRLVLERPADPGSGRYAFVRFLSPLPDDRHFLVHYDYSFALWDMDTPCFCWWDDADRGSKVRKSVVFPDGKRFVALDTSGMVHIRDVEGGDICATLHVLPKGFIWETPPDDSAPSGWLWTDREDLISVVARSTDGHSTEIFREGDEHHKTYMKVHNNRRMVMARIEGKESYQQQAALYAGAVDTARVGNGISCSLAALPVGSKGDSGCPEKQAGLPDGNETGMISRKEGDGI